MSAALRTSLSAAAGTLAIVAGWFLPALADDGTLSWPMTWLLLGVVWVLIAAGLACLSDVEEASSEAA